MKTLLFVYNADSGIFNAIKDGITKTFDPVSYGCRLCALTYGVATMKGEWRRFTQSLPIKTRFLHRDEFRKEYTEDTPLPASFIEEDEKLTQIITKTEYDELTTLRGLMALVRSKLQTHGIA